jgi:hypothetical protein
MSSPLALLGTRYYYFICVRPATTTASTLQERNLGTLSHGAARAVLFDARELFYGVVEADEFHCHVLDFPLI